MLISFAVIHSLYHSLIGKQLQQLLIVLPGMVMSHPPAFSLNS